MSLTPNARRVLEAAGIEVRNEPGDLFSIPVEVLDGALVGMPDTVFVIDVNRMKELSDPRRPEPDFDSLAWKVKINP